VKAKVPSLIQMKGDDFKSAVTDYVSSLKKAKKTIDVSHLPAPGKLTTQQGIALNQAFSYVEAAVVLLDKASENFGIVVGSKGTKSK
jgi:hypothetical protein